MKIYLPIPQDDYELALPVVSDDINKLTSLLNGEPRSSGWSPVEMQLVQRDEKGHALSPTDAPWFGSHALVLKAPLSAYLSDSLLRHGELLKLNCKKANLCVFNVTSLIDCLDEAASKLRKLSSGRVFMIDEYCFHADIVKDFDYFKIPTLRVSPVYFSERSVEKWISYGVKGLDFKEIWSIS